MAARALSARLQRPLGAPALAAERPLGGASSALLWGGLSMTLLAFVPGAYLVPALRLRDAIAVALAASAAGGLMLALVAGLAARQGKTTVGLIASTLGVRTGPVVAALLLVRHVAWAAFALAFAADAAARVPALGGPARAWAIALGALALALALVPARTFVRVWMGWFAFWVGLALIALMTLTGVVTYGMPMLHNADGLGGWPTRAQGFDLIAALPLLWLPVVADYAKDTSSPRAAMIGTGAGAAAMTAWYAIVGVLWVFTVSARDVAGFVGALPVGAGGVIVVVGLQANAVTANLHAASLAGGRFGYRWARPVLVAAAASAIAVAIATDALSLEGVLQVVGAVFVPLFTAVLVRGVAPELPKPAAWAAWAAGVLAYGWINPGDFAPWREALHVLFATVLRAPFPLGGDLTPVPATLVSAAVAVGVCALGIAAARAARRA